MTRITGTFLDEITCDIPPQNWDEEQWAVEFDTMRQAGIDTVILIRAGFRDMAVYPSEALGITDVPDLAAFFLDQARRRGMKLFFGCYDSGKLGYEWKDWRRDWEMNRKLIPEIYARYGQHPAFQGWYCSPETVWASQNAVELYGRITGLMKETAPLPVLISPGWPSYIYRDDPPDLRHGKFIREWEHLFSSIKSIDYVAFQDGSCCYGNDDDQCFELERYMQETLELCRAHQLTLWANIETFSWKFPVKFPSQDWRYLKRRIEHQAPYAEKLITFEFSHFLSPNSMYPAARHLYRQYMRHIVGEPS